MDASPPGLSGLMKALPSPAATAEPDSVLANIGHVAHIRVSVNDLVAFEYVCERTQGWKWGLGTVAAIPSPRLVQLMLWTGSGGEMPPEESPVSGASRAAAVKRLEELQRMRRKAEEEMEDLNKTLAVQHAHYSEGRAAYEADAARAEKAAAAAREEVRNMEETDWREIRSYVNPPEIVKFVMEAMLLTLGERTLDWSYVLKVIRQRSFQKRLEEFDSRSISLTTRRRVRKEYLSNPRFTHRDSMGGSRALGIVQRWVAAQLATSEATVDIMNYDQARIHERSNIEKMEDTLRKRRNEVEQYKDEETQLKRELGDSPVHINHSKSASRAARSPKGHLADRDSSPRDGKSGGGANRATPRGRPGAPPLHENIYGTANTWTFTDNSSIILHSSILVNYDDPASTVVTLTPEQVEQLKKALEARAALYEEQQRADAKIKDLEDDLEDLRGALACAWHDLADAKEALASQRVDLAAEERAMEDAEEAAAEVADASKAGLPKGSDRQPHALSDLTAALEDQRNETPIDKNGRRRGGRPGAEPGKDPVVNGAATNGCMPSLFHARDGLELAKIIDRLEKEICILRNESKEANAVLDGAHAAINGNPQLKQYLDEVV
ncbi:hypothetical protein LSCM1_01422 [Leishmania martiniquensis]|uniref:Dynein heavy chain coiled coil stalk domain-containing protein n=1 Tax=Leishmania martiniquensis TaxID=1580590 RepID=A0A836H5J6_9TRYP|nr:hypothetical protein LSCM1_01422 [Leishmania martiniquensis]